jgi:BirA family biotin operon repressor/biotin-[acetyl-CoA-carboxylase] ligase
VTNSDPVPPPQETDPEIERLPMDPTLVAGALADPESWDVRHVLSTGSTNDDLARTAASAPGRASSVLVTEEQTAGKGRSGRQWACPPGAGLMFSVRLVLPEIPLARRGWIGATLGLAICRAFGRVAGVRAELKWPNDVLVGGLKCGGILAEMTSEAVIVGAGLNISLRADELPRADATSLRLSGAAVVDRNALLVAVLDEFRSLLQAWRRAGGDVDAAGLRQGYLNSCATIGSWVRVELPGDVSLVGRAVDVDPDGAIVLQDANGGRSRHSAGDVVHLRPAGGVR